MIWLLFIESYLVGDKYKPKTSISKLISAPSVTLSTHSNLNLYGEEILQTQTLFFIKKHPDRGLRTFYILAE